MCKCGVLRQGLLTYLAHWIFEPAKRLVHGNFELAEMMSEFTWPPSKNRSGKGPYRQAGLHEQGGGKDDAPYECVDEGTFMEGLARGYVSF